MYYIIQISYASNLNKIDSIVDSAKFKQGMLSPILHKPIISPEEFLKNQSDIIIIMLPGSYASQAIDFLKKNKAKSKCIIFKDEPLKWGLNNGR